MKLCQGEFEAYEDAKDGKDVKQSYPARGDDPAMLAFDVEALSVFGSLGALALLHLIFNAIFVFVKSISGVPSHHHGASPTPPRHLPKHCSPNANFHVGHVAILTLYILFSKIFKKF